MKCSLGISNFLEEISSLSLPLFSCVSLHWSLRKIFLSLLFFGTQRSDGYIFPFLLYLSFSFFFSNICKFSSGNYFAFLHVFFLGMVLITTSHTILWTSVHSSSGTLFIGSNPLNLLSLLPYIIISDFIQFHTPPEFSSGVFSAFFNLSLNWQ